MENLTLQENDALLQLAALTELSTLDITERVIELLFEFGIIAKEIEDCGRTVKQIAIENQVNIKTIGVDVFKETQVFLSDEVLEFMGALKIWGGADIPCPECGCEKEFEPQEADGEHWTDEKCSNANCNYAVSGEPDWDCMKGGKDYDNN